MVFFSGGTDYSAGSITLPFNASVAVSCVDVGIVDDSIAENSETFTVRIGTTEPRVTLRPNEGEVTILDNDRKHTFILYIFLLLNPSMAYRHTS